MWSYFGRASCLLVKQVLSLTVKQSLQYRNRSILRTNTNSHDEPSSEEISPVPGESRTNRSSSETESSQEDLTTSAQVLVQRIDNESTTIEND